MPIVWPLSLPQSVLEDGYQESPPNTILRTQMDAGPAKARRRTRSGARPLACSLALDGSQAQLLDEFYCETLCGGSLSFEWKHPRTGAAAVMRFVEQPQYSSAGGAHWRAAMHLEILP